MRGADKIARSVAHADRPRRSRFTPFLVAGAALAAGLLIVLAVPRLLAALQALPANDVSSALNRPGLAPPPDLAQLLAAREALRQAQLWQHDANQAIELARIDLLLAMRQVAVRGDARPLLDEAIEVAKSALHRAPAQARGWLILAEASLARDGAGAAGQAQYLTQSLKASPYDLWLAPNRTWLSLVLWDQLDPDTRKLAAGQMLLVVQRWNVDVLVRLARQAGNPAPAREALAGDPLLRQRFDALYLSL